MAYVDGFVLSVATDKKQDYTDKARAMGDLLIEHGALEWVECWGDDVPEGEITSFPKAVRCQPGEAVVFAWVKWTSKTERDQAWEKLVDHPFFADEANHSPVDGKRMILGGFEVIATGQQ